MVPRAFPDSAQTLQDISLKPPEASLRTRRGLKQLIHDGKKLMLSLLKGDTVRNGALGDQNPRYRHPAILSMGPPMPRISKPQAGGPTALQAPFPEGSSAFLDSKPKNSSLLRFPIVTSGPGVHR